MLHIKVILVQGMMYILNHRMPSTTTVNGKYGKRNNSELGFTFFGITYSDAYTGRYDGHTRPRILSSPHSITAPLAPNRLTLPPGQQAPNLSSNRGDRTNDLSSSRSQTSDNSAGAAYHTGQQQNQRPGSSRFVQYGFFLCPISAKIDAYTHTIFVQ